MDHSGALGLLPSSDALVLGLEVQGGGRPGSANETSQSQGDIIGGGQTNRLLPREDRYQRGEDETVPGPLAGQTELLQV